MATGLVLCHSQVVVAFFSLLDDRVAEIHFFFIVSTTCIPKKRDCMSH